MVDADSPRRIPLTTMQFLPRFPFPLNNVCVIGRLSVFRSSLEGYRQSGGDEKPCAMSAAMEEGGGYGMRRYRMNHSHV